MKSYHLLGEDFFIRAVGLGDDAEGPWVELRISEIGQLTRLVKLRVKLEPESEAPLREVVRRVDEQQYRLCQLDCGHYHPVMIEAAERGAQVYCHQCAQEKVVKHE